MNLIVEKGGRKPAPQLMLTLDFDEDAHPRAATGTTGKYRGGEFVPKEQAPAPKALLMAWTSKQKDRVDYWMDEEQRKHRPGSPEFRAIGDLGLRMRQDDTQRLGMFIANTDHPLIARMRAELGLETQEKPGHIVKKILTPAMTQDDYDGIADNIDEMIRNNDSIIKDSHYSEDQKRDARERRRQLKSIPYDPDDPKGVQKLTAWMLKQPYGDERVDSLLGMIGDQDASGADIAEYLVPAHTLKLRQEPDEEFGNPKEQWFDHMTRSPYFKRWFGDWENDPESASKVVDPETGEPAETWEIRNERAKGVRRAKEVYHGTGKGGFDQFVFTRTNPGGLVGPGFYFTEDASIAEQYIQKERPDLALNREMTEEDRHKLIGALETLVSEHQAKQVDDGGSDAVVRLWAGDFLAAADGSATAATAYLERNSTRLPQTMAHFLEVTMPEKVNGLSLVPHGESKVYSAYLNIRNPWDADRPLTKDDIGAIAANWPEAHSKQSDWAHSLTNRIRLLEECIGKSTVQLFSEFHQDAQAKPSGDFDMEGNNGWAITKALQDMGYDGLTHIGGNYISRSRIQHRVWVAWQPTQVKAAEAQTEGTFDPTNENIYKGKRKADAGPQLVLQFDEDAHPRAAVGTVGKYHGGEFVPKPQATERHFDDTYTGPRHTYGLHNRPASYGNIPDGWIINSQREHPDYRHGVVDFPRELTPAEVASFELEPVVPDDQLGGLTRDQLWEAKRFVAEMEGVGGWSEKEAADLKALSDAYRAGPQALHDFLQGNRVENDFALTLADNIKLPPPAAPMTARRPINERDRGAAMEYLSDAMGVLEERGDEPESSLHILRRAFLSAAKSPEALDEFLQIPAVRENPHIAKMLKLMDAMDPGNSASPQAVRDRFGLRAIHFGGSLTPNEKQNHLEALSGALSLLSRAVGLPEEKLGLSNHLGLAIMDAIGPGVRAAYSPSSRSIQIDSYKGESLAHEWFHALDDAFGRQAVNENYMQLASRMGYGMWNREASPEVFDALANLIRCINLDCPQWMAAAKEMDKRQFGDNHEPYWSGIHEMCARSFAAYVRDKWALMGPSRGEWNSYLMGNTEDYQGRGPDAGMTPPGMEKKVLNEKFDALFAALAANPALLKALFDKESHPRADKGSKDPKHRGGQFVGKDSGSKAPEGQGALDFDGDDLEGTLSDLEEHGETAHLNAQEDQGAASDPEEGQQEGGGLNRRLTDQEAHAAAHQFGQARNEVEESGDHEGDNWKMAHAGLQAAQAGPQELERHLAAAGDEDPHAAAVKEHLELRAGSQAGEAESPRAKAFKTWFGDSKVVEDGEPALVHHGTQSEFDAFDEGHKESTADPSAKLGFFFTESQTVAKRYAGYHQRWEPTRDVDTIAKERHGKKYADVQEQPERQSIRDEEKASPREVKTYNIPKEARLISGYLSIQNPYEMPLAEFLDEFIKPQLAGTKKPEMLQKVQEFRAKLESQGYDGIKQLPSDTIKDPTHEYSTVTWIAFKPTQFKAEENEGAFDPRDPNMNKGIPHDVSQEKRDPDGKWTAAGGGGSAVDTLSDSFGVKVDLPQAAEPGAIAFHLGQINAGFHDLASVLGLEPSEIGLSGHLTVRLAEHLAESDIQGEFNAADRSLTMGLQNGKGKLAHEWFHALDNALARNRFPGKGDDWYLTDNLPKGELGDAMEGILDAIDGSLFQEYAKSHDIGGKAKYWSEPIELTARAFESYVEHQLGERGRENTYLVNTAGTGRGEEYQGQFHPTEEEDTGPIFAAFDRFMDVVRKNRKLLKSLRLLVGVEG